MKKIHFMNKDERNAKVAFQPLKATKNFQMGLPKGSVSFKRFVAAAENGLHEHLSQELKEDYGLLGGVVEFKNSIYFFCTFYYMCIS